MEASILKAIKISLQLIDKNPDMTKEIVTDCVPTLI